MGEKAFVKLSTTYYLDERIMRVGEAAEVLFLRMIALAGQLESDGFLSAEQVRAVAPRGCRSVAKRVLALQQADLIAAVTGGYRITNYGKWQRSRQQIAEDRERNAARQRAFQARRKAAAAGEPNALVTEQIRRDKIRTKATPPATPPNPAPGRGSVVVRGGETPRAIITEWTANATVPNSTAERAERELRKLIGEGIPFGTVRAGFTEWLESGMRSPGLIPDFVARAANGGNNGNRSTTDQRVMNGLALVAKYAAMDEEP
jgi:hypothetical protein